MRTPSALRLALLVGTLALAGSARAQFPPQVAISTNPPLPVAGVAIEVRAQFDQPVTEATVFLRPLGSSGAFTQFQGQTTDGRLYTGTVPASLVTPRGIEAYVRYVFEGETLTDPEGAPDAALRRFPVFVTSVQAAVPLAPRAYRMATIPLQFVPELGNDGAFARVFVGYGPYDDRRWRVLRWDEAAEQYREAVAAFPDGRVTPGLGFWVARADGATFRIEQALTAGFSVNAGSGEAPVEVELQPGWNQIGSPFDYPMPWSAVQVIEPGAFAGGGELVSEPVAFRSGGYVPGQTSLAPWEGYFVENRATVPLRLQFRAPPPGGFQAADARPLAERMLERLGPGGYLVQLAAESGDSSDHYTFAAVAPSEPVGRAGEINLDAAKAPPSADGVRVVLEDPLADAGARGWMSRFARPDAARWTVAVSAPWTEARTVTLRLIEHGTRPDGRTLVLRDASGEVVSRDGGSVTLTLGGSTPTQRLTLDLAADAPALPVERRLEAFPNPARPGEPATLRFWVPDGESATLSMFDALGRRVAHLAEVTGRDAWEELAWDGRDATGHPLPSGLYVIRLSSGDGSVTTRRWTLIR